MFHKDLVDNEKCQIETDRRSRQTCTATCCVLLKPVEFVRELFPAYNPDVVVKVPP